MSRCFLALLFAMLAAPAAAQLYKWVDEKGVTNYGSTPPANARSVEKVDDSRVSTVPGLTPEQREAAAQRAPQQEVDQPRVQADPDPQWRERCLAARRVDCDDPYRGELHPYDPGVYPYYPVAPPPRPTPPRPLPPRPGPRPTPR